MQETFMKLPMNLVQPSATNPRRHFDQEKLNELAATIKKSGLMQPIICRPQKFEFGDGYEIVAGERRWRAHIIAELKEIDAIVRDISDSEMLELQITENVQRADMHPLEEAEAFQKFRESKPTLELSEVAAEIGAMLGKKPDFVYQRLRLLDLTQESKQLLLDGLLLVGHADLLCRQTEEFQYEIITELCYRTGYDHSVGKQVRKEGPYQASLSINALRKHIREHSEERLLSKMPWSVDDDTFTSLPACSGCPKRTCANRDLFGESTEEDSCMDSQCFSNKMDVHIRRRIETLKSEGLEVICLDGGASSYSFKPSKKYGIPVYCSEMMNSCENPTGIVAIVDKPSYRAKRGQEIPVNLNHSVINRILGKKAPAESKEDKNYKSQLSKWKIDCVNEFRSRLRGIIISSIQEYDLQELISTSVMDRFNYLGGGTFTQIAKELGVSENMTVEEFAKQATPIQYFQVFALTDCWWDLVPTSHTESMSINNGKRRIESLGINDQVLKDLKKSVHADMPKPTKPGAEEKPKKEPKGAKKEAAKK